MPNRCRQYAVFGLLILLMIGCLTACLPDTTPVDQSELVSGSAGFPWWNDTVFYEIFVRSYFDSNADGIGDFNGITQKLDYLNSLGIKGLWLMPVFPSPSYHGYDVIDYYSANPDYGSLEDFKHLIAEAHKVGIRIILDLPMNHTSIENPWFQEAKELASKYREWYIWSETDPAYLGPWGAKAWHPVASGGYYYGVFSNDMPDLNYRNPEVTQEMQNIVKFWLDLGVDGFRLDGAKHLIEEGKTQENTPTTLEWFKQFKPFYKGLNPQAMVVGEVWSTSFVAGQYVKGGGMDLVFDFDLASAMVSGALNSDAAKIMSAVISENNIFKGQQFATFLTNHDMNRMMTQVFGNAEKAKAAATVYLTSPGVPFIYYGEEIGMSGAKPDPKIRTPMQWKAGDQAGFTTGSPWSAINSDYPQVNVERQSADPGSLLSHYRKLIEIRNKNEALRIGDVVKVETGNSKVYGMLRTTPGQAILVLLNLDKVDIQDYSLSFSSPNLNGKYSIDPLMGGGTFSPTPLVSNGSMNGYKPLATLPANANLVLLLKPAR